MPQRLAQGRIQPRRRTDHTDRRRPRPAGRTGEGSLQLQPLLQRRHHRAHPPPRPPHPGERVLEFGTGTGYTTALLATRTGPRTVVSIEIDPATADGARQNLEGLGLDVHVITGDGELGPV
ncbi:protein-L-isoaspartate O-methyltransferase family protein [Streptomyces microflavus]|uniref:protein-L-isoaspartate O-methyltransferase family protein n=1 Tax=Streptomyces microflavus TaxID=1919 RepID=UPI0033EAAA4F